MGQNYSIKSKNTIIYVLAIMIRVFLAIYQIFFFSWPPKPWGQLIIGILEPYQDYKFYYRKFAEEFVHAGWLPYLSNSSDPILASFLYPPFFLYVISVPAILNADLVFFPLLLADILLPGVIYQFLKHFHEEEVAQWGFLAIAFCPLSIFYNGGFLFNMSLVVLVFVVSLYFVYVKRFKWATFTLAISFLFKQIILFFIVPILLYTILKSAENEPIVISYLKQTIIHCGILGGTLFVGSLPWLLLAPGNYLGTLFMGQRPTLAPDFDSRHLTWPVHWYSFLIELKAPYWLLYVVGFLNFTMLGIIIVQLTSVGLLLYWYKKNSLDWLKILDLVVYTAVLSHLFLPRGVYKYYFTLHVPLVILWICFHIGSSLAASPSQYNKFLLLFLITSLIILILHRLLYLLFFWLILILMLKWSLSFAFMSQNNNLLEN